MTEVQTRKSMQEGRCGDMCGMMLGEVWHMAAQVLFRLRLVRFEKVWKIGSSILELGVHLHMEKRPLTRNVALVLWI